jgi:crotonobetainyl-CoA:carnitine CoA-transferase CaiB-like acyl-CoA transferase
VIKIEPLGGDPMRHIMPVPDADAVKSLQGKESVAVDLGTAEGRAIVQRLAARADAVVVGYRGGVAERLGVDWATLARENPRLVHLAAPGYGVDGPCARKPAFAPTIGVATGIGLFRRVPRSPTDPAPARRDQSPPRSVSTGPRRRRRTPTGAPRSASRRRSSWVSSRASAPASGSRC